MAKTIKLKIPYSADREKIVLALANSGYKVWVEEQKFDIDPTEFYVVFKIE